MLQLKGVSKKLGDFHLENINMDLPSGYIMGLIGPNGSGKTTLLNLILGLYKPDEGEISVFEKEYMDEERAIHENIGFVLQEKLFEGYKNLQENGDYYGKMFSRYQPQKLTELLKDFGVDPCKYYKELSKGEELKFQFAFALSHDPKLLILDEPTGNFDSKFRDRFLILLKDFISDGRHSVILATHLTDDLDRIADYIMYLEKGKELFSTDIESLRDTYRLVTGEAYKLRLLPQQDVVHIEEGSYVSKAMIRYYLNYPYDQALTFTIPTIEEMMYFITKRNGGKTKNDKKSVI